MAINKPDFLAGYSLFYESARYGGDFMAAIENNRDFSLSLDFEVRLTMLQKRDSLQSADYKESFRVPSGIRTHDIQNHNLTL